MFQRRRWCSGLPGIYDCESPQCKDNHNMASLIVLNRPEFLFQITGKETDKLKWQFLIYDRDGSGKINKIYHPFVSKPAGDSDELELVLYAHSC